MCRCWCMSHSRNNKKWKHTRPEWHGNEDNKRGNVPPHGIITVVVLSAHTSNEGFVWGEN